jgi:hypothetical protein
VKPFYPAIGLALLLGTGSAGAVETVPVLVELFTSEGCSSCPSADRVLAELEAEQPVEGALIVPLSLHVDYWNRLGWKDPFSDPMYSARQHGYSDSSGRRYTPQMVVDGKWRFIGSAGKKARAAVAAAAAEPKAPASIRAERLAAGRVRLAVEIAPLSKPAGEVLVSLALVENSLATQVKRGENAGRRLEHAAVVRSLSTIGSMGVEGFRGETALRLDREAHRYSAIAFAQETSGDRRVLAVGQLRLDDLDAAR